MKSFDMTPIIDVVFLLIIFFMLVCQFIVAENFPVQVPDEISQAQPEQTEPQQQATITVMVDGLSQVDYALGSQKLLYAEESDLADLIAAGLEGQMQQWSPENRVVLLRADRAATFEHMKHALTGVSASSATQIKLAVIKGKR